MRYFALLLALCFTVNVEAWAQIASLDVVDKDWTSKATREEVFIASLDEMEYPKGVSVLSSQQQEFILREVLPKLETVIIENDNVILECYTDPAPWNNLVNGSSRNEELERELAQARCHNMERFLALHGIKQRWVTQHVNAGDYYCEDKDNDDQLIESECVPTKRTVRFWRDARDQSKGDVIAMVTHFSNELHIIKDGIRTLTTRVSDLEGSHKTLQRQVEQNTKDIDTNSRALMELQSESFFTLDRPFIEVGGSYSYWTDGSPELTIGVEGPWLSIYAGGGMNVHSNKDVAVAERVGPLEGSWLFGYLGGDIKMFESEQTRFALGVRGGQAHRDLNGPGLDHWDDLRFVSPHLSIRHTVGSNTQINASFGLEFGRRSEELYDHTDGSWRTAGFGRIALRFGDTGK